MKALLLSLQKDLDTVGLKYLHCYLLKNGHNSSILYLRNFNPDNKEHSERVRKFVLEIDPSLIGISLMSDEYYSTCNLTKYLKSINKTTPIIWGGIHPTISPESCLDYADYVCIGEGERTILDVANAIDKKENIKDINNLCYLESGRIKRNALYPHIENLDEIPIYDHIPRDSFVLEDNGIPPLNKKNFRR